MKAKVKLGLARMNPADKTAFAFHVVSQMTGNIHFPSPDPSLADVSGASAALHQAIDNAADGSAYFKAVRDKKEEQLDELLTGLGFYVERIAKGNEEVILSAGMHVKAKGRRQKQKFEVLNAGEGKFLLRTKAEKNASYIWFVSTNPADENSWKQVDITLQSSLLLNSFESGKKYWFRSMTITHKGKLPFTQTIGKIAM